MDIATRVHRESNPVRLAPGLRSETGLLAPVLGYWLDEGLDLPTSLELYGPSNLALEDAAAGSSTYYYTYFYGREHVNMLGEHSRVGPVALSWLERPENGALRALLWTRSGDERLFVPEADLGTSERPVPRKEVRPPPSPPPPKKPHTRTRTVQEDRCITRAARSCERSRVCSRYCKIGSWIFGRQSARP
jgi:hypothetical protein